MNILPTTQGYLKMNILPTTQGYLKMNILPTTGLPQDEHPANCTVSPHSSRWIPDNGTGLHQDEHPVNDRMNILLTTQGYPRLNKYCHSQYTLTTLMCHVGTAGCWAPVSAKVACALPPTLQTVHDDQNPSDSARLTADKEMRCCALIVSSVKTNTSQSTMLLTFAVLSKTLSSMPLTSITCNSKSSLHLFSVDWQTPAWNNNLQRFEQHWQNITVHKGDCNFEQHWQNITVHKGDWNFEQHWQNITVHKGDCNFEQHWQNITVCEGDWLSNSTQRRQIFEQHLKKCYRIWRRQIFESCVYTVNGSIHGQECQPQAGYKIPVSNTAVQGFACKLCFEFIFIFKFKGRKVHIRDRKEKKKHWKFTEVTQFLSQLFCLFVLCFKFLLLCLGNKINDITQCLQ